MSSERTETLEQPGGPIWPIRTLAPPGRVEEVIPLLRKRPLMTKPLFVKPLFTK